MVEVVMDWCVDWDKFLQTSHAPEFQHRLFSSAEREIGVFTTIVQPASDILYCFITNDFHGSTVRPQSVRSYFLWISVPFHKLLKKHQGCLAVAAPRNIGFQYFTLMIDGSPPVMCLVIGLHKYFVQVPSPVGVIPGRRMKSFLSDLARKQGAKSIPPIADCFMANIDASFMKKVFDISQRKRKSDVHHHSQADDLRWRFEIAEGVLFCHARKLVDVQIAIK